MIDKKHITLSKNQEHHKVIVPRKRINNISSNENQLKLINDVVNEIKSRNLQITLISCVFLLFYKTGRDTLTRMEIETMLEEEIMQYSHKIVSSNTERSCVITLDNYKQKVKDILKKKKWFNKNINKNNEVEYRMQRKIVASVLPRIISQLKSINNDMDFFAKYYKEIAIN